jgi:anti-anti-sigma regulatory factor
MTGVSITVESTPDGTRIIRLHGTPGGDDATSLRRLLVQAIRHDRPRELSLDLTHVDSLDPISLGTIAAACQLGDDHDVAVFLDNAIAVVTGQLTAAGVPAARFRRRTTPADSNGGPNA